MGGHTILDNRIEVSSVFHKLDLDSTWIGPICRMCLVGLEEGQRTAHWARSESDLEHTRQAKGRTRPRDIGRLRPP
jgi:hypothetical protein